MRVLLFLLAFLFTLNISVNSQIKVNDIHYYPSGELTLCKGCGHAKSDTWRGKFIIENLTDENIVIYGEYLDGEFFPGGYIQRRNPNVCEWRFGNGKTIHVEWNEQSYNKKQFILKPKQSFEFDSHFSESELDDDIRFTVYIKRKQDSEPTEVISDAFSLAANPVYDQDGKLLKYEVPKFEQVNETCDPGCKISIDQAPVIREIKLGMTINEFKSKHPKAKISKLNEKGYNIKVAHLWDWTQDAYNTSVTFYNEKVAEVETQFNSLEDARSKNNFYELVAEKIGLKNAWKPYQSKWECKDFLVDVLTNKSPTITVWDKTFIEIRDKINEENLKK